MASEGKFPLEDDVICIVEVGPILGVGVFLTVSSWKSPKADFGFDNFLNANLNYPSRISGLHRMYNQK